MILISWPQRLKRTIPIHSASLVTSRTNIVETRRALRGPPGLLGSGFPNTDEIDHNLTRGDTMRRVFRNSEISKARDAAQNLANLKRKPVQIVVDCRDGCYHLRTDLHGEGYPEYYPQDLPLK